MSVEDGGTDRLNQAYVRAHLRFGWWALLVFLTLGIVLEAMHALKVGWYLNVDNETRRLMWTLAHAHGTLLALVNIAFAATLGMVPFTNERRLSLTSRSLLAANLLLPAGFFLGGIWAQAGDPGIGIVLVPVGAVCLLVSVWLTAISMPAAAKTGGSKEQGGDRKGRGKSRRK